MSLVFILLYFIHIPLTIILAVIYKFKEGALWSIADILRLICASLCPILNVIAVIAIIGELDKGWFTKKRF